MRKLDLIATAALLLVVPCMTRAEGSVAELPDVHSGLKEMAVAGTLVIPNSSAKDTLGVLSGRIDYYVSGRSVVGVGTTLFVHSQVTELYATAFYRYLLRTGHARFQPYLGASVGSNVRSFYDWGGTEARFLATGDVGFRHFLARRTGLDVALSLNYIRGAGEGFTHTTSTVFTVGLAHVF
jgi:hypothetical protein